MASGQTQSLWQTFKGVWAAFLGVQSSEQQREDFTKGKASHYIIIGLVFVALFILVMVGVVKIVLSTAT